MKHKLFSALFVLSWLAASIAPATASWTFASVGSTVFVSNPSCARYLDSSNSSALCAAIVPSGIVEFIFKNGSTGMFGAWTNPGGESLATFDPSCAYAGTVSGKGQVVCAARGANGKLLVYQYVNGSFGGQLVLTQVIATAPSCAWTGGSTVACLARGTTGEAVLASFNGVAWGTANWSTSVLNLASEPVLSPFGCAPDNAGHAVCAFITTGSGGVGVYTAFGSLASDSLGGTLTNPPVCTDSGIAGRAACFVTGTDSAFNVNEFAGTQAGTWSGWSNFGGLVHGGSCAEYGLKAGADDYVCGVTGLTDTGFWVNTYNGSSWSGWSEPGNLTYIGIPSCIALNVTVTPGWVMCMIQRTNGAMEAAINKTL